MRSLAGNGAIPAATGPVLATRPDSVPQRPGIYYRDAQGDWTELLPSVTSQLRLKGLWGTVFSFGIARTRTIAQLSRTRSDNRFAGPPVFRFRFDADNPSFGRCGTVYQGIAASSPAEFALARMEVKAPKDIRQFQTGRFGYWRIDMGVPEEGRVPFAITRLGPDLFEVTMSDIGPGEYGWVLLANGMAAGGPMRVYDFGVGP